MVTYVITCSGCEDITLDVSDEINEFIEEEIKEKGITMDKYFTTILEDFCRRENLKV